MTPSKNRLHPEFEQLALGWVFFDLWKCCDRLKRVEIRVSCQTCPIEPLCFEFWDCLKKFSFILKDEFSNYDVIIPSPKAHHLPPVNWIIYFLSFSSWSLYHEKVSAVRTNQNSWLRPINRPPPPPRLSHPHRITWFSVTFFFVGLLADAAAWENPIKSYNFNEFFNLTFKKWVYLMISIDIGEFKVE